jgi:hypothetical protein
VPGLSILGGAMKMGAVLLNPTPTMHDLRRLEKKLEASSGLADDALDKKLEELQEKTFSEIEREVQILAIDISEKMKSVSNELQDVKLVLAETFKIVSDVKYKDSIEKIDAAFDTYIDGSNNLSQTFHHLEGYLFEMQSLARRGLSPTKVLDYLNTMKEHQSKVATQKTIEYILLAKMRFLAMISSFYIFKKDFPRVGIEFENFNNDYHEITVLFEKELGYALVPGQYPSAPSKVEDDSSPEEDSDQKSLVSAGHVSSEYEQGKIKHINKYTIQHL